MTDHPKLLLIGGGNMGKALLSGWLADGLPASHVQVIDPGLPSLSLNGASIACHPAPDRLPSAFLPDMAMIAVKPQMLEAVLPAYAALAEQGCVFISIAAGASIEKLAALLGKGSKIIRVMPNTPALVGQGCSVGFAGAGVSSQARKTCHTLFEAVGKMFWVEDEELMHSVTALSGSGPAYLFHFIECLSEAATELGLPESLAMPLAKQTVLGSAMLADQSTEPVSQLRKNVTSPGGTTQAALEVFMGNAAMQQLVQLALAAAASRSRQLAS